MKFCDKLVMVRKKNNMSQEQLADRLGISRQAISKWESGVSMPDMEKIMQLCKILNCSLEELVDDGVSSGKMVNSSQKINFQTYLNELLEFITKSLNMFWSMRLIEKIRCILEMGVIILLMILIWKLAGSVIYSIFDGIIYMMPGVFSRVIYNIGSIIYSVFGLIVGVIIFIHIFKIRYLDYFVTIEDNNVNKKIIEDPVGDGDDEDEKKDKRKFIEKKRNKIIIRDPKHSTYSFFGTLARIVMWLIKLLLLLVGIFGVFSFICLVFGLTFVSSFILDSIFFLGISIVLIGTIVVNFIILRVIYNFILNHKENIMMIFYIFMIGLVLVGVGIGISFCAYLTFDKDDRLDNIDYTTYSEVIEMNDYILFEFLYDSRVEIIIDDSRDDIGLEFIYNKEGEVRVDNYISYNYGYDSGYGEKVRKSYLIYYFGYYGVDNNFFDSINYFMDKLEEGIRIDEYDYIGITKIKIYISNDNLEVLKNNLQEVYY